MPTSRNKSRWRPRFLATHVLEAAAEGTVAPGHLGGDVASSQRKDGAGRRRRAADAGDATGAGCGRQRNKSSSTCHGSLGGQRHGGAAASSSTPFHYDRLRDRRWAILRLITHGSASSEIRRGGAPADRWRSPAYVRALQAVETGASSDLDPADLAAVEADEKLRTAEREPPPGAPRRQRPMASNAHTAASAAPPERPLQSVPRRRVAGWWSTASASSSTADFFQGGGCLGDRLSVALGASGS